MLASVGTRPYWCSVCVRNVVSRPIDGRADEQRHDVQAAGNDERQHEAGQHGMGDGVAHQAHPPQHEVAADERAGDVRQRADQNDAAATGERACQERFSEQRSILPAASDQVD